MRLSNESIAEMANASKRMREFGKPNQSVTIDPAGVSLSLDMFVKTFEVYAHEEKETPRGKYHLYKSVAGGVLFSAIATETEVIAHIERSKYND